MKKLAIAAIAAAGLWWLLRPRYGWKPPVEPKPEPKPWEPPVEPQPQPDAYPYRMYEWTIVPKQQLWALPWYVNRFSSHGEFVYRGNGPNDGVMLHDVGTRHTLPVITRTLLKSDPNYGNIVDERGYITFSAYSAEKRGGSIDNDVLVVGFSPTKELTPSAMQFYQLEMDK
jgi:hypothetical protein